MEAGTKGMKVAKCDEWNVDYPTRLIALGNFVIPVAWPEAPEPLLPAHGERTALRPIPT